MTARKTAAFLTLLLFACGGGAANEGEPARSPLMDKTTAGQNRCVVTKSHEKPFVIEWDATDLSSFEAKAAHDVVVVRYEGCHLTVLECSDNAVRGKLGAYRAPEWTSGTVEGFEMKTEDELYAQLPLGAASLAGRIQSGEALKLRYWVSGVAMATRDALYRSDLPKRCEKATHFVYAYNLGAFELASSSSSKAAGSVGFENAGGGGGTSKEQNVLKRGGEIDSCRDEAGRSTRRCQVPIRIALRAIEDGTNPEPVEKAATKSGADALMEAGKMRNGAGQKLADGDAVGCLKDLDRADEIDPDPEHVHFGNMFRAQCMMKTGRCEAGKELLRSYFRKTYGKAQSPENIEGMVKSQAGMYCAK